MRVLTSVRQPTRTTNPYIVQLADAVAAAGVDVRFFSWRRGLLGRRDVLHMHWPEVLVRRDGRLAQAAARARFALLLTRLSLLREPMVRTLHNVEPHERGSSLERTLLRWCDRCTTFWVLLNPHTPLPRPGPSRVIPLGHYLDWYAAHPAGTPVAGRMLSFGLLRPYKGIEALLAAFAGIADPGVTLRLVGRPVTDELRAAVGRAAAGDPRLTARLEHVDDATLAAEVGAAQLVVLPHRALHNSSALLLALSRSRPALVPATSTTSDLAAEVGPGWVHTYEGELSARTLVEALAAAREAAAAPPDLGRRNWTLIGQQHAEVYREAHRGRRKAHRGRR